MIIEKKEIFGKILAITFIIDYLIATWDWMKVTAIENVIFLPDGNIIPSPFPPGIDIAWWVVLFIVMVQSWVVGQLVLKDRRETVDFLFSFISWFGTFLLFFLPNYLAFVWLYIGLFFGLDFLFIFWRKKE